MEKLLITGSSGFLGSSLLPKFLNQYKVYALVRSLPKKKNPKIKYIIANLFDEKKIQNILNKEKFKYLIHLAWYAKPKLFWISKFNFKFLHASKNLYNYFCINGGKYAILSGSSAECNLKSKVIKEEDFEKILFQSRYEISKYLLMKYVQKISKIFDTKYAWVRIFWTYGPNQPRGKIISDLAFSIKKNQKFIIKNRLDSINLLHVKDIAEAIFRINHNQLTGIVNIASKKNFKIYEIFQKTKLKTLKKIIQLKIKNKNFSFNNIIIKKLKKIGFYEKYCVIQYLNSLIK